MPEVNDYDQARRDAALEIMAAMIGTWAMRKWEEASPEMMVLIAEEEEILCWERDEIMEGNKEIIGKALTVYAKEIRGQRGW